MPKRSRSYSDNTLFQDSAFCLFHTPIRGSDTTSDFLCVLAQRRDLPKLQFRAVCYIMSNKLPPLPASTRARAKELERNYAQLAAVEALIRALEAYRQFYPRLVPNKRKTA
jgi:hypothetical protein